MAKSKMSFKDTIHGFKSIACRNSILIMIILSLNSFSINMKNAVRTLIGLNSVGLSPTAVGILGSVFTLVGFLIRTPAGSLSDTARGKLKNILIAAFGFRVLTYVLWGYVSSASVLAAVYVLDAITWAFIGVACPALLAISVDRRVMGSAYAIYSGLSQFVASFGRPLALTVFNGYGQQAFGWIAAAIGIVPLILTFFLDNKAIIDTVPEGAAAKAKGGNAFKKLLAGFNMTALPFAIVTSLPVVAVSMENQYVPKLAELTGLSYLAAETAGSSLNGISRIVLGVLCDFVNPSILVVIIIGCMAVSLFGIALAETSLILSISCFVFKFCVCWAVPLNIAAMKLIPKSRQGSLFATTGLVSDAMTFVSSTVIGYSITNFGYSNSFMGMGVAVACGVVIYIFTWIHYNRHPVEIRE